MKAAFFNTTALEDGGSLAEVFTCERRAELSRRVDLLPTSVTPDNFDVLRDALHDVEVIFSTWGMWELSREQIACMPRLKALFYAAGSVRYFAGPLLDAGIMLVSAWKANAIPVAQFTLAQILLGLKGYWANSRVLNTPADYQSAWRGPGVYGETVALIGAGQIGRQVIELLRPFDLKVKVVDPYLTDAQAMQLGVEPVSLEQAFSQGFVVSNHLPNLPALARVLTRDHFALMRPGAVFINTGRGAQVDQQGLMEVMRKRPDLTALLDVTDPEPPEEDSSLYKLANVHLTTHIAGSMGHEVRRMADFVIRDFDHWQTGGVPDGQVTLEMLANMA